MRADHHGWTRTVVKWPNRIHSGIDAYTLGRLTFVLLIIFMVAMPNRGHHWGPDLPRARYATPMPRAVREDAQIVSVSRDGRVFYRNLQIAADDLPDKIREGVRSGADRKVYIRADAWAKYMDANQVLNEVRKAGIENVCFLAERVSR